MPLLDVLRRLNPFSQSPRFGGAGFGGGMTFSLEPSSVEPWQNSLVASLINWTTNNSGTSSLEMYRKTANADQDELISGSPAGAAWARGDFKRGRDLVESGTLISLIVEGTAFLYPLRTATRKIVGFQYLPHPDCRLDSDGMVIYTAPNGQMHSIPESELIILTLGADPRDIRRGYSPLKSCLEEILTDQEAAQYSRAVLQNFGVIGGLVGPKPNKDNIINGDLSDFQVKQIRRLFGENVTGENRGKLIVSPVPLEYQQITATPEAMVLEKVRRVPEERISAAFNIPAVVLGFGAGLDRSTYNNMREARRAAWSDYLIPLQDRIARQLTAQLLPQLESDESLYLGWDRKNVEALREDEDLRISRYERLFRSDIITRDEARMSIDLEASGSDGFYSDLVGRGLTSELKSGLKSRLEERGDVFDG